MATGGIINAYAAVKLAEKISSEKKQPEKILPKAKMKGTKKG